ncbi:MAG TPA: pyridoxal phosphate-dependent aminotransferase [Bacillota bacterium]|jgi:aspartate aminotransferase
MELSQRVRQIAPSATLAMDAKAKQMEKDGFEVVNFTVGEPDFDTPKFVKEGAQRAIEEGFTKYTAAAGIMELRQAICKKLKDDNGLDFKPNQIVTSNGAKHSLYNSYQALCNPGDEVILQAPYWVSYPEIIRLAGGVPVVIETGEKDGFKMTPAAIEAKLTKKTKVINLNSPGNPTGAMYNAAELKAIADLAVAHNLYVVSDEVYEKLVYDGLTHTSIASFGPEIKARTVVINGLSKAYAMTGWRMGYCACEPELAQAMSNLQGHMTSNPSSITQRASLTALTGPQEFVREMVKEFARRRDYMVERIKTLPGFSTVTPRGAFYVFPSVKGWIGRTAGGVKIKTADDLSALILEKAQAATVPGSGFGAPDYIRFSYSTSMQRIKVGFDRIEKVLKELW